MNSTLFCLYVVSSHFSTKQHNGIISCLCNFIFCPILLYFILYFGVYQMLPIKYKPFDIQNTL